jgi:hypothetical protein
MSLIPHFEDSRLTDGCEVVSLIRRPRFTTQEDSWYSFLLEAESTQVIVGLEELGKLKKNAMTSSGFKPAIFPLISFLELRISRKSFQEDGQFRYTPFDKEFHNNEAVSLLRYELLCRPLSDCSHFITVSIHAVNGIKAAGVPCGTSCSNI